MTPGLREGSKRFGAEAEAAMGGGGLLLQSLLQFGHPGLQGFDVRLQILLRVHTFFSAVFLREHDQPSAPMSNLSAA